MKDNHIQYIELYATDLEKIKKFYSRVFGWTFTDYGDNYTAFESKSSGVDGGFEKIKKTTPPSNNSRELLDGRGALVILYHSNLELAKENVTKGEGVIVKDIFSFPGGRRFQFTDPSGNELAVWSDK